MLVEEQRYIHEDLERLEQGIADRMVQDPKNIRDRLNRDHEVAQLLDQIQRRSTELLAIYSDQSAAWDRELQHISINPADPSSFDEFYRQVATTRAHHARYPNEQAENSEAWYRPRRDDAAAAPVPYLVDHMFSGEEAYGRFFDLHAAHEAYLNLAGAKRLGYLQYLDVFDDFAPGAGGVRRADKLTDPYFRYLGRLVAYLESFLRRTRPLDDLDKLFAEWEAEFDPAWRADEVPGWQSERKAAAAEAARASGGKRVLSSAEAVWCEACEREFKNRNVHDGHLGGRKHMKAAEVLARRQEAVDREAGNAEGSEAGAGHGTATSLAPAVSAQRRKERAVAGREFRVRRLTAAMKTERDETRVNVERRQGMTERERQQELENLYSSLSAPPPGSGRGGAAGGRGNDDGGAEGDDDDAEDRVSNPLKLPLAWDGKPIPFWLYRLHGLGQEFSCEICGNYVYRGRRAFDKHFNETNHITNLKRLGIINAHLFRDITSIEQALKLWDKIQRDHKKHTVDDGSVVQMEDAEGNVMPEKVYLDLQKQGLL